MFDTSGTDQQIRHGVYLIRLPPDNQNFQAIIVIQVYVQRGNNGVLVIVLQLRKPFRQQSHMVVVHQGDRAHDFLVGGLYGLPNKAVANQVSESLGAVGVSLRANESVEAFEKIGIHRNPNSAEFAHVTSSNHSPTLMCERSTTELSMTLSLQPAMMKKRYRPPGARHLCQKAHRVSASGHP
jgi:hypothetical protein